MTSRESRSGSFRGGKPNRSRDDMSSASDSLPNVTSIGYTVGGRGMKRGLSNSPWGNEFHNRKKFFERMKGSSDEEESFTRQSYTTSSLPSTGNNSPSPHSNQPFSPKPTGMIDETGQKERVPQENHSSQSQSDNEREEYSERKMSLEEEEEDRDRLLELEEQAYLKEKGNANKQRLPSHFLDGRNVHKDQDKQIPRRFDRGCGPTAIDDTPTLLPADPDEDLVTRIDSLYKEKYRLESKLQEITDKNAILQRDLSVQRKNNSKAQEKSIEMKKKLEILRSENSHLMVSLNVLEKERDDVSTEKKELMDQLEDYERRLIQMEKFYHEAEDQNQALDDELSTVIASRDMLREQKNKLDQEIQESRKVKENLRGNMLKLKDKNEAFQEDLSQSLKDKTRLKKEMERKERENSEKVMEMERKMKDLEMEKEKVTQQLREVEKEHGGLTEILKSSDNWKAKYDQLKKEEEILSKKFSALTRKEQTIADRMTKILKEIDLSINAVLTKYPSIKVDSKRDRKSSLPNEILRMLEFHKSITSRLNAYKDEVESSNIQVTEVKGQLKETAMALEEKEKVVIQMKAEVDDLKRSNKEECEHLKKDMERMVEAAKNEREIHKKEMSQLLQANETLEEDIEEVSNSYHSMLDKKQKLEEVLTEREGVYRREMGRVLAERACVVAELRVTMETAPSNRPIEDVEEVKRERDGLRGEVEEIARLYQESTGLLEVAREDSRKSSLEMDKVKIQFMTEISLLKSHLSTLEKDKSELEMQVNSSESSTSQPPSAFQPVPAPAGGPPAPRKILIDQQELFTLQQKVTYLENQNKKLNDMIHTGSASIDSGNILRRQNLEMKKKVFFLESEKKQLTEKVASLHNTIKSMRESKDRMSHDRLKTLQEENISLQDRIRNMEDMFTRKLVDADGKIASTVKENDILRHKLNFIPEALKLVEKFCQTLMTLSTQIQSQEESLVGLKASLLGSGSTLSPISEIMERVLKNHNDIQSLVSAKTPDEQPPSRSTSSFNRHTPTNAPYSALPPVLQHFSPEYISSLQGATSPTNPSPTHLNSGHRTRSQSHSHVSNPVSSMYEVREKISQIFADNLSIKNLIKHFQENLSLRHSEVGKLQGNLFSYQSELKQHLKFLEETHSALMLLWQQELPSEQLNSIQVLENQVETWQDKVYARDMALKDIELQMKEDYESHNKLFLLLKSQLLDQKDENSMQADTLRSKDQYIHEIEERSLNAESELYKLRKEMERVMQEALNVPEGFQLQNHGGNVSELIRLQNEELHRMKTALSDYIFQINQLQAKVETLHRENSLLQHQGIELERHHQQIRDELYTERDYLRKLVEQQLKAEDASDLLKLLKRSQETTRDQREMRKLASELENVKLILREKDMRISELQHQLEIQQLDTLKSMYPPVKSNTGDSMLTQQYPLMVSGSHGFARPRSAGSAEARIPRYMIMDPNHPKAQNRNKLPSTLEDDFLIHLPPTTNGESVLFNLSEKSDSHTSNGGYVIGYPVVTDDEGGITLNDESLKHPQKNRVRKHRRTASTGSDSLKNFLSSGSSASDSRPPHQCSTLPLSVTRQHKPPKRPGSADSMRMEVQSPTATTVSNNKPHPPNETSNDVIGQYAKDVQEEIGEMISQTEREMTTPTVPLAVATATTTTKDKITKPVKDSNKTNLSLISRLGKGPAKVFVNKWTHKDKDKTIESTETKTKSSSSQVVNDEPPPPPVSKANHTQGDVASQIARNPSMASSVGRSDSFASTVSTTFSGVGGESSPYSTLSLDSLLIDSFDMLQYPYQRMAAFTPIVNQSYLPTSSSDEESRSYSSRRATLKRGPQVEKSSRAYLTQAIHHRANSSCDSDQLLSSYIPLHRTESISISDMDKELTDTDEVQDKIDSLQRQLGKVRRSSTGSITICNNSGSSLEDIKSAI